MLSPSPCRKSAPHSCWQNPSFWIRPYSPPSAPMNVINRDSKSILASELSGPFKRLAQGINLALLLAAPTFLALTYGATKCGTLAVPALLIFSAVGLFVFLIVTRTWGGFFLANVPVMLLAPVFAWYSATFAAPLGEDAIDVLINSNVGEALGFLGIADLCTPFAACASAFILYVGCAVALWNSPIQPGLRRSYLYSALPTLAIAVALPVRGEDGNYSFDPARSADASVLTSYLVGALASLVGSATLALGEWENHKDQWPNGARLISDDGARETHVLVIGESARFDAFHING
jgi:glucan phosphoethanolaminetransferase (alkaline phosphatase superfamily)